jgi:hypothetical protein
MKILRLSARIIVGLTFIFSGVVKAIDPLGSAYKFHDYFQAFNLGFLDGLSLPLGIILCAAEFIAGFAVLTGIRQKSGVWVVLLLMAVFTPLTFILALTNPVSDCGCFGDAIHLTNWQTFWKNIIIVFFTLILFRGRKYMLTVLKPVTEWATLAIVFCLFFLFSYYNLRYLPVIDFLPYKTGVKIAEKMVMPEGVAADEYHTTFIYEKDGERKEFELSNYPAEDSTWKFIDQKSVLIKKGYQPPIHDFVITSMNGIDITQTILSNRGYSVFMVSKKLAEAEEEDLSAGFEFGRFCMANGIDFYVLTASGTDEVMSFDNGLSFCSADETTLKTMVRANPGYMLIKDGTIIGKWSWANLPQKEWFEKIISENK